MSDPRVRPGLDKQLPTDAAASKNVSSQAPTERRAHPERVLPSSAPSAASLRNRPHGVRAQPAPAPLPRPGTHPRNRRRSSTWQPPKIALPAFHRPTFHRPTFHRPAWRLSLRQTFSLAVGLVAVIAIVCGLVLLIPSKPTATPVSGSVRQIDFRAATQPPTGDFHFGPYFVAHGSQLLMMGSDGNTSTVWSSSDGSTWEAISAVGSFAAATQRFVVLGFSDDGNGGLIAVGDAFVSGSKVAASAWHSRDGRDWTPAALDFPANAEMIGLASRTGALVAAGNGVAWFSQDGMSWTMEALPDATGYVPRAVRTWGGGFAIVAVGAGLGDRHSAVWISADGRAWTQAATPLDGFQVRDLVGYGNGLVAVGSQTLTSAELTTPSPSPSPSPTASASGSKKPTAKPTAKPTKSPSASGSAGASAGASGAASPSPTATPSPTVETAASWSSSDGIHWFRGILPATPASLAMESVTQVQDSLVAAGSEPGAIPGASAAPASPLALWVSDDGTTWKPVTTSASSLTRSRLTLFDSHLVLAGIEASGALSVLTGDVALGSPLPAVVVTPTPAFSLALHSGTTPMIAGITAQDTLGPVVATSDRFLVFVSRPTGTTVWSSADGSAWAPEADPTELTATGPAGKPVVADAVRDAQGGIIAVGKVTATSGGDSSAIWRLAGDTWTAATINGAAPTALSSVAAHRGSYVAAAGADGGPRLLFSDDGMTWIEAAIPGATGYTLSVTSWSGGFVASGPNPDGSGTVSVWTSSDGLTWTGKADWKLPAKSGPVYGAGSGLVTTSTSVTGDTSWWWSADGKSWQDSKLTTTGGCWGAVDAGVLTISAPPAGSDNKWSVFASKDARSWQKPTSDTFSFGVPTPCRVASLGQHVLVVGWLQTGVLHDFYGDLTGL